MLKKLLASTAVATLIASGAYAQTTESEEPQVQQEQQQDRVASAHGQEILVQDGDTIMLDSADIEFTIRLNSGGTSAVPGQNMAAGGESTGSASSTSESAATDGDRADDSAETAASDAATAPDSATEETAEAPTSDAEQADQTADSATGTQTGDRIASDSSMNDGDKRVSHGNIIVVQSDSDSFSLNFEVAEADDMAAASSTDGSTSSTAVTGTDSTTTGAIDRSKLEARGLDQIRAEELIGSNIYGADDANIGSVGDVIMTQDGQVDAVLVDVGGFLGIGSREVAIGLDNIEFMVDDNNKWYVYTPFTEEQLENQPEYNADTYANERDQQRLIVR